MMRQSPIKNNNQETSAVARQPRRKVPRRTAARIRMLQRRASTLKRHARRAAALALIGAMTLQTPMDLYAQYGQAPMGQPQGIANGAISNGLMALGELNNSGPGFFYYGFNGADRGLGYIGSYATFGGFIPYAQDDFGGFYAADLRTHLSVNGGFFSNVGVARKQLTDNGSLIGLGLYWDYDGDLYQYAGEGNSSYGQFGHVYNQIGVSGEYLSDYGTIRSNGYMPVGETAHAVGAPGDPFSEKSLYCGYGLDAALGGADLEVGAWIPALADWGGMISVGGYALGNSAYTWGSGTDEGEDVVPWFGGVYTRMDLTIANNWDFSLQYNNDPYFDSTGFARITYRMGGSRRRNVPDQMEQPMMRNEHIVRAHKTPEIANRSTTGNPWNVVHVDNTAAAGGNGSAESPYNTLGEAQADPLVQNDEWTIVYVHEGNSTLTSGSTYGGTFAFQQNNQFLVGSGGSLILDVQPDCGVNGLFTIPAQSAANPVLNNVSGASVQIGNATSPTATSPDTGGVTMANLAITGSQIGIRAYGNLSSAVADAQGPGTTNNLYGTNPSGSAVRNVIISGNGSADPQRGIWIAGDTTAVPAVNLPSGRIEMTDTAVANMTNVGFLVGGTGITGTTPGGSADIDFSGTIRSDFSQTGVETPLIGITGTTGGNINLATTGIATGTSIPNEIRDVGGEGILISANNTDATKEATTIKIGSVTLNDSASSAIAVSQDYANTSIETIPDPVFGSGINKPTNGAAILIDGGSPTFDFFGTINNSGGLGSSPGYLTQIVDVDSGDITITGRGTGGLRDGGDGIFIGNIDNDPKIASENFGTNITMQNIELFGSGSNGINITNISNGNTGAVAADQAMGGTQINIQQVVIGDGSSTNPGPTGSGVSISNIGWINQINQEPLLVPRIDLNNLTIDIAQPSAVGFQLGNVSGATIPVPASLPNPPPLPAPQTYPSSTLDQALVTVSGTSSIQTSSITAPAIRINNAGVDPTLPIFNPAASPYPQMPANNVFDLQFVSVVSGVPSNTTAPVAGDLAAIIIDDPGLPTSKGLIDITSNFTVGALIPTSGTGFDVLNLSPYTTTLTTGGGTAVNNWNPPAATDRIDFEQNTKVQVGGSIISGNGP